MRALRVGALRPPRDHHSVALAARLRLLGDSAHPPPPPLPQSCLCHEDEGEKTPALSPSKIPVAIPKAPTPAAAQQEVDLKFERRDSAAGDSSTVLPNPYLSTGQRSDLKEPHFDEIKPAVQLDEPSVLKRAEKKIDECACGVWNSPATRRAVGIAALAAAIGAVVYYKYR
ncbi:hypothetical protein M3Y99_00116800 [Aphelenchoides fujianensis]|nr:hypothetical protein M3Y99_00116800 [Aphelenchoides fujianensis]